MGRYTVAANVKVLGHEPGKTFSADIPERQEARLLASGALKKAKAQPTSEKE